MATKSKKTAKPKVPEASSLAFNCCQSGDFLIHKDLFTQVSQGLAAKHPALGAGKARFIQFSVTPGVDGKLLKPTLKKRGSGGKTTFTFTLDIGDASKSGCA